jgi:hypothetical protein
MSGSNPVTRVEIYLVMGSYKLKIFAKREIKIIRLEKYPIKEIPFDNTSSPYHNSRVHYWITA